VRLNLQDSVVISMPLLSLHVVLSILLNYLTICCKLMKMSIHNDKYKTF